MLDTPRVRARNFQAQPLPCLPPWRIQQCHRKVSHHRSPYRYHRRHLLHGECGRHERHRKRTKSSMAEAADFSNSCAEFSCMRPRHCTVRYGCVPKLADEATYDGSLRAETDQRARCGSNLLIVNPVQPRTPRLWRLVGPSIPGTAARRGADVPASTRTRSVRGPTSNHGGVDVSAIRARTRVLAVARSHPIAALGEHAPHRPEHVNKPEREA